MKKLHRSLFMKAWKLRAANREAMVSSAASLGASSGALQQISPSSRDDMSQRTGAEEEKEKKKKEEKEAPTVAVQDEVEEEETVLTSQQNVSSPWMRLGQERCEELLEAAARDGAKSLNTSKLSVVGEGRAGKTAWIRALCNMRFEETESTIGMQQNLLEVRKVDVQGDERGWSVLGDGGSSIPTAAEAAKRRAAEIALAETPEEREARLEAARKAKAEEEERKKLEDAEAAAQLERQRQLEATERLRKEEAKRKEEEEKRRRQEEAERLKKVCVSVCKIYYVLCSSVKM